MRENMREEGKRNNNIKILIILSVLTIVAAIVLTLCITTVFSVSGNVKPVVSGKDVVKLQEGGAQKETVLSMQIEDIMIQQSGNSSETETNSDLDNIAWKEADYAIPGSDSRLLTQEELKNMSKEQLKIGRNEILARHGRIFREEGLRKHFESKSWYQGTVDPDQFDADMEIRINDVELKNLDLIKTIE